MWWVHPSAFEEWAAAMSLVNALDVFVQKRRVKSEDVREGDELEKRSRNSS